ncbi:hypothetical protein JD844_005947 [Phrynosoma platyrhinos]|uniref:Homeobox domain-containing protein n=1 Tax=Phrynosoma platyrhinos TaxID=52577 RepID=A0ABQ7TPJ8_PHRPL|nr:hypothetical protein JD844_005947 [Phrynosoma platyrhinos]
MASFDSPTGLLPMRTIFNSQGATTILATQKQSSDPPEQRDLPAPQRTKPSPHRVADFSIRSILALDGSGEERRNGQESPRGIIECSGTPQGCTWINGTRFKPPYVPKTKQAGSPCLASRSPRVPFSATQLGILENSFQQTHYLSTGQVRDLALLLGLTENRVKIWFQNRRARERRDFLKQHPNASVGMKGNPLKGQSHLGWH